MVSGGVPNRSPIPSLELVPGVQAGKVRAMARLITRVESGDPERRAALTELYRQGGRAQVVGLTGVPGSGKSTLVREYAKAERARGRKIAVLAIDPSSPFSGGAILGDRIRMTELTSDPGIFIRSMASRGALGGLARAALEAVDVLDAGGFDTILLETVGVGQDEVDVAQVAHTTVVVSAPGLGDDIQAIKAGVLEIADLHVVSKCDKPEANRTLAELRHMLHLGLSAGERTAWKIPVLGTSAESGEGVETLLDAVERHWRHLHDSGEIHQRRRSIAERRILKLAEELVRDRFVEHRRKAGPELAGLEQVIARGRDPHTAAVELLNAFKEE